MSLFGGGESVPFSRNKVSLAFSTVGGVGNAFSMVTPLMWLEEDGVELIWQLVAVIETKIQIVSRADEILQVIIAVNVKVVLLT